MQLTKEQFLGLLGKCFQGALANPTNGYTMWDSYSRQQLFQGIAADIMMVSGMIPEVEDEIGP